VGFRREPLVLFALTALAVALSAIAPHDATTWLLEAAPVLIAGPVLAATARRFPLTPLLWRLLFLHALVLLVGAHWTYARVPLGEWAKEAFGLARNPYDRLGHFAQGFVPALLVRELLLRLDVVRGRGWCFAIVVAIALAFSALYELFEWATALLIGEAADSFLGSQGDPWDTQNDMFLALVGAVLAQLLLGRMQERQVAEIAATRRRSDDGA
jgi:putative membrane protein